MAPLRYRIDLKADSIRANIAFLAKKMQTTFIEKNNEYLCPIPDTWGSGYVKALSFPNGIEILEISGIFSKPLELGLENRDEYVIKMIFNQSSELSYSVSSLPPQPLKKYDSLLHAFYESDEPVLKLGVKVPVSLFKLNITGNSFIKKLEENSVNGELGLGSFLKAMNEKSTLLSKSSFTLGLHDLIKDFVTNDYSGPMRYIYKEAKANEIIVERIRQYMDDKLKKAPILRKSTLDSVETAARFIASNLDSLPTIKELSRQVGLSQKTLQSGFQHQFGCSVNEFINNVKLKRAAELLENSNLNISEITYELGINSKSYFSKIFSERYGLNPSEYRKSIRHSEGTDQTIER